MAVKPWWEQWQGLLEEQLRKLDEAGIKYEIDKDARNKGTLVLHITHPYEGKDLLLDEGEDLLLQVIFPDSFPFFRFEIKGLNFELTRHQNPFAKNLCLIGRSTLNWDTDDTLADFITNQLPNVIRAGLSPVPLEEIEELQAEPFTDYYPYVPDLMLLFDSAWSIDPTIKGGALELGATSGHLLAILEVRDTDGGLLVKADDRLARLFRKRVTVRWVRSKEAIREGEPRNFQLELTKLRPDLASPVYRSAQVIFPMAPKENVKMDITGILFPEEVADSTKGWVKKDGWVFLLHAKKGRRVEKRGFRPITEEEENIVFMRPGRAGHEDMFERIPELRYLKDKKIAIFGLGCLGAPSALEFARCGVGELRILDYDIVEPGTIVRWPLGIEAAGKRKTEVIKSFIEISYPYTKVESNDMRIGAVREPQEESQYQNEVLEEFINGVDLIYDATAEVGVQYFLSFMAFDKGIPYICLSSTYGAWGGYVARVIPGRTGCWTCLKHWQDDYLKDPSKGIPLPNQDEASGVVQPQGCANPTFTGASFDGGYIALDGVRLTVSTLLESEASGYPAFEWDIAVINLRDENGNVIAPEWKTYPLKKYPSCSQCDTPA